MVLSQPFAIVSTVLSRSFVANEGRTRELPLEKPNQRNRNRHRYRVYLVSEFWTPIVLPPGELQCLRRMPRLILRKMSAEQPLE